jgi:hypothetical protein
MEIFVMRQLVNVLYVNLDSTDTYAEVNKNLKEIKSQLSIHFSGPINLIVGGHDPSYNRDAQIVDVQNMRNLEKKSLLPVKNQLPFPVRLG